MPAEFVLPAGLYWAAPPDPPPEEGFELSYREDDETPHYFLYAQLSSLRLERFFMDAMRCLPPKVKAVLEIRRPEPARAASNDGRETDRWASDVVPLEDVLRVASKYSFQLLHDGMVGFGAYDPDSPLEVFLDDHKLVSLFAPEVEPFVPLLESFGVPQVDQIASVLDVDHEHVPLFEIPDRSPEPRREWLRRRRFDPRWFAPAIQRALAMTPQQDDDDADAADDADFEDEASDRLSFRDEGPADHGEDSEGRGEGRRDDDASGGRGHRGGRRTGRHDDPRGDDARSDDADDSDD